MTLKASYNQSNILAGKIRMAENAPTTREIARLALRCFDLTSLRGDETEADIFELYDVARYNDLHCMCVLPDHVAAAHRARALKSGDIVIATVINFPFGNKRTGTQDDASPQTVTEDVRKAIEDGARQIDIVLAHDDFRAGRKNYVTSLLKACRKACDKDVTMKVVMETASFESPDELRKACRLAIAQGANCLKTSTGKHEAGGADLNRAAILFDEAYRSGQEVGVKISGGIKTAKQCAQYITLARSLMGGWNCITPDLFRIGGSSLLQPLIAALGYNQERGADMELA